MRAKAVTLALCLCAAVARASDPVAMQRLNDAIDLLHAGKLDLHGGKSNLYGGKLHMYVGKLDLPGGRWSFPEVRARKRGSPFSMTGVRPPAAARATRKHPAAFLVASYRFQVAHADFPVADLKPVWPNNSASSSEERAPK